jgi:hypothetical protein
MQISKIQPGDFVEGTISVAPNARNVRDLDIVIDYKVQCEFGGGERREYKMSVHPRVFSLSFFGLILSGRA